MKNSNLLLFGSVILIVLAIPLVSLLSRPRNSAEDVRARAAVVNTLQMNGTVASVDEVKGVLTLDNVYLADESRSGEAKSLGSWEVTAPANFNFASISPGQTIIMNIDSKTFLAQSHTVTALTITPLK